MSSTLEFSMANLYFLTSSLCFLSIVFFVLNLIDKESRQPLNFYIIIPLSCIGIFQILICTFTFHLEDYLSLCYYLNTFILLQFLNILVIKIRNKKLAAKKKIINLGFDYACLIFERDHNNRITSMFKKVNRSHIKPGDLQRICVNLQRALEHQISLANQPMGTGQDSHKLEKMCDILDRINNHKTIIEKYPNV